MSDQKPTGRYIYVMGASGAGKDSVMAYARAHLPSASNVVFSHRYVTRAAELGHENYVSLNIDEFEMRRRKGFFRFDWQAHGLSYGIGIEAEIWRRTGVDVVVSGSRTHFATLPVSEDIQPVLIDAPVEILRQRLTMRGREDAAAIEERLQRGHAQPITHPALTVINNAGSLATAGGLFVEVLASSAA
jgi:ribose 1,5-bisphosphokinase